MYTSFRVNKVFTVVDTSLGVILIICKLSICSPLVWIDNWSRIYMPLNYWNESSSISAINYFHISADGFEAGINHTKHPNLFLRSPTTVVLGFMPEEWFIFHFLYIFWCYYFYTLLWKCFALKTKFMSNILWTMSTTHVITFSAKGSHSKLFLSLPSMTIICKHVYITFHLRATNTQN